MKTEWIFYIVSIAFPVNSPRFLFQLHSTFFHPSFRTFNICIQCEILEESWKSVKNARETLIWLKTLVSIYQIDSWNRNITDRKQQKKGKKKKNINNKEKIEQRTKYGSRNFDVFEKQHLSCLCFFDENLFKDTTWLHFVLLTSNIHLSVCVFKNHKKFCRSESRYCVALLLFIKPVTCCNLRFRRLLLIKSNTEKWHTAAFNVKKETLF